jgi:hypothetical protein
MSEDLPAGMTGNEMPPDEDFSKLDDSALLSRRAQMRAELERLPVASRGHAVLTARYDRSTQEVNDRARRAWARTEADPVSDTAHGVLVLPARAAMLLAVEVLLAEPEALGNDALEGDLYILRDQLRAAETASR